MVAFCSQHKVLCYVCLKVYSSLEYWITSLQRHPHAHSKNLQITRQVGLSRCDWMKGLEERLFWTLLDHPGGPLWSRGPCRGRQRKTRLWRVTEQSQRSEDAPLPAVKMERGHKPSTAGDLEKLEKARKWIPLESSWRNQCCRHWTSVQWNWFFRLLTFVLNH